MRSYWDMDEEVVYEIIKKARLLPEEEKRIVPDMEFGFDRARKEGMLKGIEQGKRDVVERMLAREYAMPR